MAMVVKDDDNQSQSEQAGLVGGSAATWRLWTGRTLAMATVIMLAT